MTLARKLFATAAAAAALALVPLAANATTTTYDFSSPSGLTYVGNAHAVTTSDGAVARIVPALGGQSGAVFSNTAVTLGSNATFSTSFQFRFTNPGGIDPADGIVFILSQGSSGLGTSGYGIGYNGVPNSVGIEFDTYNNGGYENSSNHVAIDEDGALNNYDLTSPFGIDNCQSYTASPASGCMSNGDLWSAAIGYDGSSLTVQVTDPGKGTQTVIDHYAIDIPSLLGTNTAYVGFTGATGAGWENEDITSWSFSNTTALINPPGGVPEPGEWALMLIGFLAVGFTLRAHVREDRKLRELEEPVV